MVIDLKNYLILFLFIIFIYQIGFILLKKFFSKFINENNVYINLSASWFIGNAFLTIILMDMFFFNWLNFINKKTFSLSFFITSVLSLFLLIRTLKNRIIKYNYLVLLILIVIFFIPLITSSLTNFLIWWDAVAIWFFKAKALFDNSFSDYIESDQYLFSSQFYPIGIPLVIATYYRLIEMVNDQAIQFYFFMFYFNLVILTYGILIGFFEKIFNRFILLLTVLSFYISANFIIYAHNGYVDLILGSIFAFIFYLLISFFQQRKTDIKRDFLKLIFIFLGYQLLIKNEAIPFFTTLLLSLFIYFVFKYKKINIKEIFFFSLFLIIFILPFAFWQIYLKINQVPSFLDGHFFDFLKIENIKRIKTIFNYWFLEIFNTDKHNLSLIPLIFLFIVQLSYLLWNHQLKWESFLLVFIFFNQLLSYIFIYIITPLPYVIQIESSLERLFLHLLPMFFIINGFLLKEVIKNKIKKDQ